MSKDKHHSDTIEWVVFPDNSAMLKRMIRSDGSKGLLLQFSEHGSTKSIRQRALDFGFKKAKNTRSVYHMVEDGVAQFSANALATALEGHCIILSREKLYNFPWTLDYREGHYGYKDSKNKNLDSKTTQLLGTNHLGDLIYTDASQVRYRKIVNNNGQASFLRESGDGNPTLYLRANTIEDLPQIAHGLLHMAERGSITQIEFKSQLDSALAGEALSLERANAISRVKLSLVQQILEILAEDSGSRKNYHRAVRACDHLSGLIDFEPNKSGFVPTLHFLIILRRLLLEATSIEFSGCWQLKLCTPELHSNLDVSYQLYDHTKVSAERLAERSLNILANRNDNGISYLIVSGDAEGEAISALRQTVGRAYILEIVAEFDPHIATGHHDDQPVTVFIIGRRRTTPETSLPVAAQRTFRVNEQADLDRLYIEILRSRKSIQNWLTVQDEEVIGTEHTLDDISKQRPYNPLSKVSAPFTMIAKSLEGATAKALRRVAREFEHRGGVDISIAESLNVSLDQLKEQLLSEQIDAVAMCEVARNRNRAFLLADQTGIGKGRSLAAIAYQHIRNGGKVLYFTENTEINIPDVWRDFCAIQASHKLTPCILAAKRVVLQVINPEHHENTDVKSDEVTFCTLSSEKRKAIFISNEWPTGCNLVLTNYSQFRSKKDSPARLWGRSALDDRTLIILDESQNAINPSSNTGEAIREMIDSVGRSNVVYATATPMRNQFSASLYRNLLPQAEGHRLDTILNIHISGGETAQESFTTMLAEDGVYLRRDHNLSYIDFQVRLPDDQRIASYQEIMNRFSPLLEAILDCTLLVDALAGHHQGQRYIHLLGEGVDEVTARSQSRAMNQYSFSPGGSLSRLTRLLINAMKIDQVVKETLNEINEGRKPLITFHSTGAELFRELINGNNGSNYVDRELQLGLADQILRVIDGMYIIQIGTETVDARMLDVEIQRKSEVIQAMIAAIPDDLSASPLDTLVEALQRHGLTVGEISGRQLVYRNNRILRRKYVSRRAIVESFNSGKTDILIYNMAGATGGSYHASPEFADQRPRSLIEMETPLDIIKYVQAQGRSNRYGQVARPRIVSVMTGLIPEMRILQQRNCKLRSMGASIDGNRSHPLLLDDIPDLLNRVGNQAAKQVLNSNHDIARRLGLLAFQQDSEADNEYNYDTDRETDLSRNVDTSLANRVLTRSIVLEANLQSQLMDLIKFEFDAIVEELDSRNENPLRPKEFPGEVEIRAKTLYSGFEFDEYDLDISAFFAPVYLSTGMHHYTDNPISADMLQHLVNQARIRSGRDGFSPYADILQHNLPTYLQPYLLPGTRFSDAMNDIESQPARFKFYHKRLTRLLNLLQEIRPGRILNIDSEDGQYDRSLRTIVKLNAPEPRYANLPQAYKIHTVAPGSAHTEIFSLSRLIGIDPKLIRFGLGLEVADNHRHLKEFAHQSTIERAFPVQVMSGNLLVALDEARRNKLGSMSLYRDNSGQVNRGIIINRKNVDINNLPVLVPSSRIAGALVCMLARSGIDLDKSKTNNVSFWVGERDRPTMAIFLNRRNDLACVRAMFVLPKLTYSKNDGQDTKNELTGFYASNSELYNLVISMPKKHMRNVFHSKFPQYRQEFLTVFSSIDGLPVYLDGIYRNTVNQLNALFELGEDTHEHMLENAEFIADKPR